MFACILMYSLCFAIGISQTPWVVISEIIPLGLRSTAVSLAGASSWITNFTMTAAFRPIADTEIGRVGIWLFLAVAAVVMYTWVYLRLPETKQRKLEEIELLFGLESQP